MEALMIEKPFSKNSLLGKVREVLVGDAARSKGAVSERCTI
jgi:hypothetical protein